MDVSFCPHDEPQPGWRRSLQPSRPRPGLPRRVTTDREPFVRCSKGKGRGINELTRKLTKRGTNRIGGTGQLRPPLSTAPESCFRSPRSIHGGKPTVSTGRGLSRPAGGKSFIKNSRRLDPSNREHRSAVCCKKRNSTTGPRSWGMCWVSHRLRLVGNMGESGRNRNPGVREGPNHHHPSILPFFVIQEQPGPCMPWMTRTWTKNWVRG
jgi:hypothetical protein